MNKKIFYFILLLFTFSKFYSLDIEEAVNDYYSYGVHVKNGYWKYCCSSFLREENKDSQFYGYKNLFDDNIATSWVEGSEGSGINEYLLIPIYKQDESMFSYRKRRKIDIKFTICNGYCTSENLFFKNNRVKKAKITIFDIPLNSDLNNIFVESNPKTIFENIIELDDSMKNQAFDFSTKLVNFESDCIPMLLLKFEILDVYPGTDYDDTAISEINVYGEYAEE